MTGLFSIYGATLSPDGKYRYTLSRSWASGPVATFIMLNPSTADANIDDPTIRKCAGFARRWGMGGIEVGNLFAVRATDPRDMMKATDPVGPENRDQLERMCYRAAENGGCVICAWGVHGSYMDQAQTFLGWLDMLDIQPMALRITADGSPGHPLYVPYSTERVVFGRRK